MTFEPTLRDPTSSSSNCSTCDKLRATLRILAQQITEMQQANLRVDATTGAVEYQVSMIALALIARQFLREFHGADQLARLAAPSAQQGEENERDKSFGALRHDGNE